MTEPTTKQRPTVWICAILAALTLGVYWQVSGHDFLDYDDQDYITQNSHVQAGLTWSGIQWAFTTNHAGNWHPLTWLSHMLDIQLFGLNPGPHHLTNLALHVVNSVLLLLLLQRMTGSLWRSATVAGLFALHPLHVESVAWISERKDVLSSLFFMLTLWTYVRYAEGQRSEDRGRRTEVRGQRSEDRGQRTEVGGQERGWYWLSVSLLALGLMSKPMLVSVPFILLLLDYWPLRRVQTLDTAGESGAPPLTLGQAVSANRPLLKEKVPFVALSAFSCVITFFAQRSGGAVGSIGNFSVSMRLINALVGYGRYLRKTVWPSDLAAFYPYPASWPLWTLALSAMAFLFLTLLAVRAWRKAPWLLVGWLWFLIMLLPVIGLLQVGQQSLADRYMYLPSIGLFIGVTWAVGDLVTKRPALRALTVGTGAAAVGLCAAVTAMQAGFWKDTETLFARAVAVTRDNALAEYTLGAAQAKSGKYDEAFAHLSEAVRIKPDHGEALNNLGLILVMRGKTDEGITRYRQALQATPDIPALHYNLASALAAQNKLDEALAEYEVALKKDPAFVGARCELGATLARQGKFAEAKAAYGKVLAQDARNSDALVGMGAVAAAETNFDEAFGWFGKALELNPANPQAHFEMANALLDAGRAEEAQTHYSFAAQSRRDLPALLVQRAQEYAARDNRPAALARAREASRLAPEDPSIHQFLAALLLQSGQVQPAVEQFEEVVRLRPDAQAHFNLATALAMGGNRETALTHYREAVRMQPDWPVALNDLAWALATDPKAELRDGTNAIRLAEHAVELTQGKEPRFLGTLDACYAEVGRFADAIRTATRAHDLAVSASQKEVAEAAEKRIKLYQSGRPYRQY